MTTGRVTDALRRFAVDTPDQEALRYEGRSWTWSQWSERIRRAAMAQVAAGLRPGDRVAFLDKNHPACLETTLACSLVGTANAVVNFRLAPEEVAYVIGDAAARVVFVGAEFVPVVEQIRAKLPSVERVVVLDGGGDGPDGYEAWLAQAGPGEPEHRPEPDDCFLQLYTSGTTGFPKGAMLTHRSLAAHNDAATAAFGFTRDAVNMVAMPLFHVGGTSWALAGMAVGARTIVVREVVPEAILDEIARERVTHAFFVPAVYGFLTQLPGVGARDYSSLRCLGYGGAPMPPPLMRQCLELFPVGFYQVYGMTEMSGVFSVLGPADHRDAAHPERLLSAGRPVAGAEVRVVDPATGKDLGPGEVGEFWVLSDQHMAGYWGKPEATAETLLPDGWLRTGDAGYQDEGGYLYISDRVKDMIISGGENVYPAEVERVVAEYPGVADVAVIGVPDDKWGEAVKAVVVAAPGATVDEAGVIAHCRAALAGYKCPKSVDLVDTLPRNPTGKILRRELRAPYWAGRERQV
jgi:acyl-CoA synthetase (AMP-forming)/AMP-acid ligase II